MTSTKEDTGNNILHGSLGDLFEYACRKYGNNGFLYFINGGGYTYGEFHARTVEVSAMLSRYGIGADDKVGILSQNMPNWAVAYFATSAFGRISVPMLPDFSESDIKHILKHSECKALFVSAKLLGKVHQKAFDRLQTIILLDDFSIVKGETAAEAAPERRPEEANPESLASIIYTSGTTGSSKGVMLSHRNLCANLFSAQKLRPSFETDIWLSLLPLSHTLECSLSLLLPMHAGGSVYYIDKAPTPTILAKALSAVKPTTILSVPLIIEKLYKVSVLPKLKKNRTASILYSIPPFRKLMNRMAGKQLVEKFGGRIRFFGIGGARLDPSVEKFLIEARFPYAIGYGLTETSPLIAGAIPEMVRLGSTGPIVHGVKVRLADKNPETGIGEILVKGDNVMMGYYRNPEATAAAFTDDGWFRTKDLGRFDKDGWLYIKGRTNSTIIGPNGENIYPEEIESVINSHDMVEESVVTQRKGKLIALIHFNADKLKAFLEPKDGSIKSAHEKLLNLKQEIMEYVNQKVSRFSKINGIDEQKDGFEKTATKKIKRYLYEDKDKDRR